MDCRGGGIFHTSGRQAASNKKTERKRPEFIKYREGKDGIFHSGVLKNMRMNAGGGKRNPPTTRGGQEGEWKRKMSR